jgi:hypothetical protein
LANKNTVSFKDWLRRIYRSRVWVH